MKVIILNYDYSYLNSVSVRRALSYVQKGKVTVEKWSTEVINTVSEAIKVPLVLRLMKMVRSIYKKAVTWSKKNVMIRDSFKCVYCGSEKDLNIDHMFPQSKGGKDVFENTVTSCQPCNNRKGNRTPSEAGMYFVKRGYSPYKPTVMEFIQKKLKVIGVYQTLVDIGLY